MHGVIVTNFKRYLDEFIGIEAWKEVVSTAGLQGKTYLPVALYPDEEMEALLRAAESATGLRRDDLLADFGIDIPGEHAQHGLAQPHVDDDLRIGHRHGRGGGAVESLVDHDYDEAEEHLETL